MIMLFSSSKSMTWIYRHKERAGQKLTHFPLAFTDHRDQQENQTHLGHLYQFRTALTAFILHAPLTLCLSEDKCEIPATY